MPGQWNIAGSFRKRVQKGRRKKITNSRQFQPLRSRCSGRSPKSATSNFIRFQCLKISCKTDGGNPAKGYQENWAWLTRRVKRLRNLWLFHYVLFLIERTKLNVSWLKIISHFNWMSELNASLCRQRVRIPTIIIRELYEEKQKVCSSIHELEKWFWRKASMSETDYAYILAKRTRGKFYLPSIGFPLQEHLRAKKSQYQY